MKATDFQKEMQKPVDFFHEQIRCLRRGGITTQLIDTVKVPCYGQMTPLRHCARSNRVPKGISVEPHDPNMVNSVCKALKDAGFNAYVFSKSTVVVSVPPPSGEDSEKMCRRVRELGEEARIAVRQSRKKFKRKIGEKALGNYGHSNAGLSMDERNGLLKELQIATDHAIKQIDEIVRHKFEVL